MIGIQVRDSHAPKKYFFLGNISSNMDSLAQESKKKHSLTNASPLIMPSIDPTINNLQPKEDTSPPPSRPYSEVADELHSLLLEDSESNGRKAALLIDDSEKLRIKSESAFFSTLGLEPGEKVKVISIFGNTGEGKSYTLNKLFFDGDEVFRTSSSQTSCTIGVWAKYDPKFNIICLDTEGLLGITSKEDQRTRLLLKVLAVSDIIIYRTRAERLRRDLYSFIGGASNVYKKHFKIALEKTLSKNGAEKVDTGLGPGLIIFHETQFTNTLNDIQDQPNQSAEDILRQHFCDLGLSYDAFSFIKYVGVKTSLNTQTSFDHLKTEIHTHLESSNVRSARDAKYIYLMLKSLNDRFQSPINESNHEQYLAQFFTCPEKCQSCKAGCVLSMSHKDDGEPHKCETPCKYQHQYQNSVYLCKKCIKNGHRTIVKPSSQTTTESSWTSYFNYIWSGYVIECPKCGEIYRSRQHWVGNKNPEEQAVQLEVVHIWPGERMLFGTYNPAQKMLDGVSSISDAVVSVSSPPAKMLTDWYNDAIAPSYWRPNNEIRFCFNPKCNISFTSSSQNRIAPSKHHCRGCGEGFCEMCSSKKCPVPNRGWTNPVRVCDSCYANLNDRGESLLAGLSGEETIEVRARYISETVVNSISAVKTMWDVPKDYIKDTARPSYWTPDSECIDCVLCKEPFGPLLLLHHCRDCGKGVCDNCSTSRKPVPLKGWDSPVRVCDACRS